MILKLLTKKELADLLRTTAQTIANQISQGKEGESIPFAIKIGSNYRWNQETVNQWLKEKEHERKVLMTKAGQFETPKIKINRV